MPQLPLGLNEEDAKLTEEVVDILDRLKKIDTDRIDWVLKMGQMAKGFFPPEMIPTVDSLLTDFGLIKMFAEEARKYDKSEDAIKLAKKLLGGET